MNALQHNMECWFTAVAYADAGQPGWAEDMWTMGAQAARPGVTQLIAYGAGSVLIYVLAFAHADLFAALCAKGGLWSALPIAAVLLLSYVHGHFAAALWDLCGITGAKKQAAAAAPAKKRITASPAPRIGGTAVAHS